MNSCFVSWLLILMDGLESGIPSARIMLAIAMNSAAIVIGCNWLKPLQLKHSVPSAWCEYYELGSGFRDYQGSHVFEMSYLTSDHPVQSAPRR